jgi:hypothetical protein
LGGRAASARPCHPPAAPRPRFQQGGDPAQGPHWAAAPQRPGLLIHRRADLAGWTLDRIDPEALRKEIGLVPRAGLGLPLTQQSVSGHRVDFFWPDLGLVVETDGLTYHRTPSQQAKDRERDQAHLAAGLTPLRFTHHQIAHDADHVVAVLRSTASRLRDSLST